jgi:hypothetical protein
VPGVRDARRLLGDPLAGRVVLLPGDDVDEAQHDGVERADDRDDRSGDVVVLAEVFVREDAVHEQLAPAGECDGERDRERQQRDRRDGVQYGHRS